MQHIECHQLTFREAKTDWQLWAQVGDKPLPPTERPGYLPPVNNLRRHLAGKL